LSLAAALGLPLATRTGAPFPARGLILYLTFAVILATLVIQGGTLPALLRWLRVDGTDEIRHEEALARLRGADAALGRLDELRDRAPTALVDRLRDTYRLRSTRLAAGDVTGDCAPDEGAIYGWLRREALRAERDAVVRLRDTAAIGDDVLQTIEYELDVEALRLKAAYPTEPASGS
jgi:CPA1 family monovalent cation:H+ antiporter